MFKLQKDQLVHVRINPANGKTCEFIGRVDFPQSIPSYFDCAVTVTKIIGNNFRFLQNEGETVFIKNEEIVWSDPSSVLLEII